MGSAAPRLLVTLPTSGELLSELAQRLPTVPFVLEGPEAEGPWPEVEAWLVGSPERDLPRWKAPSTPKLRFVQRAYTGLDDFPFDRFPESVGIAGNVGGYAPFVAEHAIALLLALGHDLLRNHEQVRAGRLRPPLPHRYLAGRTVLLLGYGEIARAIRDRLAPLGPRVEAVSRTGAPQPGVARMYPGSQLGDALARADFVIECRPLTRSTRSTIDRGMLARMKPTAIFVNVGRAATVDEESLFERLRDFPEFRAGIDVWWQEDFEGNTVGARFPFSDLPNFLGTPHVAGVGRDSRAHAIHAAVANLVRFFEGLPPLHLADRSEYVDVSKTADHPPASP